VKTSPNAFFRAAAIRFRAADTTLAARAVEQENSNDQCPGEELFRTSAIAASIPLKLRPITQRFAASSKERPSLSILRRLITTSIMNQRLRNHAGDTHGEVRRPSACHERRLTIRGFSTGFLLRFLATGIPLLFEQRPQRIGFSAAESRAVNSLHSPRLSENGSYAGVNHFPAGCRRTGIAAHGVKRLEPLRDSVFPSPRCQKNARTGATAKTQQPPFDIVDPQGFR